MSENCWEEAVSCPICKFRSDNEICKVCLGKGVLPRELAQWTKWASDPTTREILARWDDLLRAVNVHGMDHLLDHILGKTALPFSTKPPWGVHVPLVHVPIIKKKAPLPTGKPPWV